MRTIATGCCWRKNDRFAMQIKKDGRFVLGVLEPKSIKVHHMGKGRYMLKACVEYYDEEKKMTLKFNGCDFFNNYEIRAGTIKRYIMKIQNLKYWLAI